MGDTIDTFRPEIDIHETVNGMREELQNSGLMHPIEKQRFVLAIEDKVSIGREVLQWQLKSSWSRFFPGVEYSEDLMFQKLDEVLARWKAEAIARFDELATRDENVRTVRNFVTGKSYYFRRWDLKLMATITGSFLTIPALLSQVFAPTDWQFNLGALGLLINLATLGFLFWKAKTNQEIETS